MKITLNIEEIKAGFQIKRMSKKRIERINSEHVTCPIFLLSNPIPMDGRYVTAVLNLNALSSAMDGETRLNFIPISCQAFTVYDKATKELNQATVLFPWGQFTFDHSSSRQTDYSLAGPGCDPEVVQKSWYALGQIVTDTGAASIRRQIASHLQQRLIKPNAVAA